MDASARRGLTSGCSWRALALTGRPCGPERRPAVARRIRNARARRPQLNREALGGRSGNRLNQSIMSDPKAQKPEEHVRRRRYILRYWVLDSVPIVLALAAWLAWDYRLTVREILSWRFLAVIAIGLGVIGLAGYVMARFFWRRGLAPDDN